MSIFTCALCDCLQDGDYVESYAWGEDSVCGDCHYDHTPENWEDWKVQYHADYPKAARWTIIHEDYDGAPIHSFEGPGDHRFFIGHSVADVWEQAMDYETETD